MVSTRSPLCIAGLVCGVAVCSLFPSRSDSQDLSDIQDITEIDLNDLLQIQIVTTKTTSALLDAPAVLVVVDREEIQWWRYQSIGEVLQHLVGFDVIDDHINPSVGVRGISSGLFEDNSTIKVMIDGVTVAFLSTSGNWLGLELIPMSAVERIEVIRGPASSLYGADAFLGVVNIITRDPEETLAEVGTSQGLSEGGYYQWTADGVIGIHNERWRLLLAASGSQLDRSGLLLPSSSPAPILAQSGDRETTDLGMDAVSVLARVAFNPSEDHQLGFVGRLSLWQRGAELAPWMQLTGGQDDSLQTTLALMQLSTGLTYQGTLAPSLQLSARSVYSMGQPLDADQVEVGSNIFYVEREFDYHAIETAIELAWQPLEDLSVVTGVETTYHHQQLPSSFNVLLVDTAGLEAGAPLPTSATDREEDFLNAGAYLQANWTIVEELLHVNSGVRYDWNSLYDSQVSGSAAIVSTFLETLTAKIIAGNAFKAPSPFLLYAEPLLAGDIIGNEELEPQYIHTIAGSLAYQPISNLIVTATVAYSRLLNKAQFVPVGVNQRAQNIADIETFSVELEARARWRWLSGYLGFTYVDVLRDTGEEGYRAGLFGTSGVTYPPYAFNLGLTSALPVVPLRLSSELSYASSSRSSDYNTLEAGLQYDIEPRLSMNASLATEDLQLWGDRVTVFAVSMNDLILLGDAAPGNAGFDLPLRPTTYWLTVRQSF